MKQACLLPFLFVAWSAQAQPVYKCTGKDDSNSYQSTRCAEGETSATRGHAAPSPGSSVQAVSVVPAAPGQRRVQVRYRTDDANFACDSARAQRTAALGAAGAGASAELRSSLDRDVQDACR